MTSADERHRALVAAAGYAGYAPSIHNTQPWRWVVDGGAMQLWAVPRRQLTAIDPAGRMMVLSCGTALHHAQVALLAAGWAAKVRPLPDRDRPDLLVEVAAAGRVPVTDEARRLLAAIPHRRTERRPAPDVAPAEAALEAVGAAVAEQGVSLHLLTPLQVVDLAVAAATALSVETLDTAAREELAYWTGRHAPPGTGMPARVLPDRRALTTVTDRDFGRAGTLSAGPGDDRFARYGLLVGSSDERDLWLAAGQGLSAGWLAAELAGLSLLPLSAAVEVDATRVLLHQTLDGVGYPLLALRLAAAHPDRPDGPAPRLPAEQVIEERGAAADR
ncbi:MAG TPA: nitroreductase [Pilimelia sp.]|nr:nitroreductase [Pilimelia sp.]